MWSGLVRLDAITGEHSTKWNTMPSAQTARSRSQISSAALLHQRGLPQRGPGNRTQPPHINLRSHHAARLKFVYEPTREAMGVEGVRGAGEQHGQPVRFLDQLPALGWHGVHDAVEHRRLHPDQATRKGRELPGLPRLAPGHPQ